MKIGGGEESGSPQDTVRSYWQIGMDRLLTPHRIRRSLSAKLADEERALDLCRMKARQKKLPMEALMSSSSGER